MVQVIQPASARELATALQDAAGNGRPITLRGAGSKSRMGGPLTAASDVCIVTTSLNRLVQYEPRDLTISVEAGMPWSTLTSILDEQSQMLPLDPPLAARATVGGVVAANCSGPRRRLYGSVRDQVIGMECATLNGDLVNSGGIVVKNVAGYDLQKLMIGSFGTLAVMASVNFKLAPKPEATATFASAFDTLDGAIAARREILTGALQPAALDLLNPAAAAAAGLAEAFVLLVQAGGSARVLDRYARDLSGASRLEGEAERSLWTAVQDFAPNVIAGRPGAVVIRAGFPMQALGAVMALAQGPAVARAANGLAWLAFEDAAAASAAFAPLAQAGAEAVIEWSGPEAPAKLERWPGPGTALEVMRDLKKLFDPQALLNPGRLYGHI